MKKRLFGVLLLLAGTICFSGSVAVAQYRHIDRGERRELRADRREIRLDNREIRLDRREGDRRDLRFDRRDRRRDVRDFYRDRYRARHD